MLTIYQRSTGLEEKLESARGDMRLTEYLNSPQAQQDRERYRRLLDQEAFDEEAAEEMEER